MKAVVLDARDSFVETLARYFRLEGVETTILRADGVALCDVTAETPDLLVLSPGPCTPREAGLFTPAARAFAETTPIFGVCLGHLAIAEAFGGGWRAIAPTHGRATPVRHDGHALFDGIDTSFPAARYHSLIADPPGGGALTPIAWNVSDGAVMALAHPERPIIGVQFHPESAMTPDGRRIIRNVLSLAQGRAR